MLAWQACYDVAEQDIRSAPIQDSTSTTDDDTGPEHPEAQQEPQQETLRLAEEDNVFINTQEDMFASSSDDELEV